MRFGNPSDNVDQNNLKNTSRNVYLGFSTNLE